jgi:hypothetical protein
MLNGEAAMQDQIRKQGEDGDKTSRWFVKRIPLIFTGYFIAVILAGAVYPIILSLLSVLAQFSSNEVQANETYSVMRLLPIALIGMLFAIPATIFQFAIAVTIAEIKQIRSHLYYIIAGALTGLTASLLLYSGLDMLLTFGTMFTISGAGIGYVYWFITIKSEAYGLDNKMVGSAINIFYRYIMSMFIAIMTGGIIGVIVYNLVGVNSIKLHELPLALTLTILMAVPYTVVGMALAVIPFLIFVYVSNKFDLTMPRHYIAAGALISLIIYYPNLFSFLPPFPNSLGEINATYFVRLLQSLIAGIAGGYVFWRLSSSRAKNETVTVT